MKVKTANNICGTAVAVAAIVTVLLPDSVPVSLPLLIVALITVWMVHRGES